MIRAILRLLLLFPLFAHAGQVAVQGARLWAAPDQTRLVVDTAAVVEHKIFSLDDPHRLVIDIPDASLDGELPLAEKDDLLVKGLRSGVRAGDDLRIVADLKQPVRAKSFMLQPNERYGHRLVVDLVPRGGGGGQRSTPHLSVASKPKTLRDLIIAIDAGHGGEDPGAIGPRGTKEKEVTLAIARQLARLVDQEPGMRAVLIRDGDYYIRLYKRIRLARKHRADLFVSIHADAFRDKKVRGSSVYTLSQNGASSKEAAWLADKENSADQIGGIDLDDKDPDLSKTIWDMVQNATMEHSNLAAKTVLTKLSSVGSVHHGKVQHARFAVLKAPDVPSMLVETAFISNADEEARLRDTGYQAKLARAILAGIKDYFQRYPPPGTRLAQQGRGAGRRHVISPGDTLSEIAEQYRVSLSSLRDANRLDDDRIRIGQVLSIPEP
jgi:N-acetylmuramoyl-L-alanine amidase